MNDLFEQRRHRIRGQQFSAKVLTYPNQVDFSGGSSYTASRVDANWRSAMKTTRFCSALVVVLLSGLLFGHPASAQYTADYQTNIISGVTSNWSGDYIVGSKTSSDVLMIKNDGNISHH